MVEVDCEFVNWIMRQSIQYIIILHFTFHFCYIFLLVESLTFHPRVTFILFLLMEIDGLAYLRLGGTMHFPIRVNIQSNKIFYKSYKRWISELNVIWYSLSCENIFSLNTTILFGTKLRDWNWVRETNRRSTRERIWRKHYSGVKITRRKKDWRRR